MDRSFEIIRSEVLEWDRESQRRLAQEIEEHLAESEEAAWDEEISRRLDAHRRREGTYVTKEQMMDIAEKMIVAAERKKK